MDDTVSLQLFQKVFFATDDDDDGIEFSDRI